MSWEIERTGDVAIVRMNSNPMNVIDEGFFSDLEEAFATLESDSLGKSRGAYLIAEGFFCRPRH